ncbi:MAG: hypothetical protein U9Q03_00835 [Patescibacteria group bacterium]|nr:hypothetical protein [Patescibacteria group bacterium]
MQNETASTSGAASRSELSKPVAKYLGKRYGLIIALRVLENDSAIRKAVPDVEGARLSLERQLADLEYGRKLELALSRVETTIFLSRENAQVIEIGNKIRKLATIRDTHNQPNGRRGILSEIDHLLDELDILTLGAPMPR